MTPILTIEPPTESPPLQVAWCANDLIVMFFEDALILVDPEGDWTSFSVDGTVHLVAEIDCLRVFTTNKHFMLRNVSGAMMQVLSTESDHPGRDLYLAREAYDAQDVKSDMTLRSVRDQLPEAIDACIEVAGHVVSSRRAFSNSRWHM